VGFSRPCLIKRALVWFSAAKTAYTITGPQQYQSRPCSIWVRGDPSIEFGMKDVVYGTEGAVLTGIRTGIGGARTTESTEIRMAGGVGKKNIRREKGSGITKSSDCRRYENIKKKRGGNLCLEAKKVSEMKLRNRRGTIKEKNRKEARPREP